MSLQLSVLEPILLKLVAGTIVKWTSGPNFMLRSLFTGTRRIFMPRHISCSQLYAGFLLHSAPVKDVQCVEQNEVSPIFFTLISRTTIARTLFRRLRIFFQSLSTSEYSKSYDHIDSVSCKAFVDDSGVESHFENVQSLMGRAFGSRLNLLRPPRLSILEVSTNSTEESVMSDDENQVNSSNVGQASTSSIARSLINNTARRMTPQSPLVLRNIERQRITARMRFFHECCQGSYRVEISKHVDGQVSYYR